MLGRSGRQATCGVTAEWGWLEWCILDVGNILIWRGDTCRYSLILLRTHADESDGTARETDGKGGEERKGTTENQYLGPHNRNTFKNQIQQEESTGGRVPTNSIRGSMLGTARSV